MSLSILFDDAIDIQIFMKVVIANVPGGIHDTTEYSVLEPSYHISVALAGTTLKLNTVSPYWLEDLLVQHELSYPRNRPWRPIGL
jgi:hypothetical protein